MKISVMCTVVRRKKINIEAYSLEKCTTLDDTSIYKIQPLDWSVCASAQLAGISNVHNE
jgi:hypothetical protein